MVQSGCRSPVSAPNLTVFWKRIGKRGLVNVFLSSDNLELTFFLRLGVPLWGQGGEAEKKKKKDKKLKKNPNPLLRIIPDLCLLQFNDSIQRFKMAVTQRQPVKQVEKVWDNSKPRDKQLCIY
jgi:hypothetical protein